MQENNLMSWCECERTRTYPRTAVCTRETCKYIQHHAVWRGVGGAEVEGSAAEGAHCAPITRKRGKWCCWLKPAEPRAESRSGRHTPCTTCRWNPSGLSTTHTDKSVLHACSFSVAKSVHKYTPTHPQWLRMHCSWSLTLLWQINQLVQIFLRWLYSCLKLILVALGASKGFILH